jgi:hypothetical protein
MAGVQFPAKSGDFVHSVQTGTGAHPTSCPVGPRRYSGPGMNIHLVPRSRIVELCLHSPMRLYGKGELSFTLATKRTAVNNENASRNIHTKTKRHADCATALCLVFVRTCLFLFGNDFGWASSLSDVKRSWGYAAHCENLCQRNFLIWVFVKWGLPVFMRYEGEYEVSSFVQRFSFSCVSCVRLRTRRINPVVLLHKFLFSKIYFYHY